jgi:hypothetical protein
VGPCCQWQKERERVTIWERDGNGVWAVLGCGLESIPRAHSSFFLFFSLFFSIFI